ncbi:MAG TPA: alginate lyase family protein [Clostridia bacterium]|nr:alginate lyase family protein [Clostridia bacterium]
MSASELAWRAASAIRDTGDRVRFPLGAYPSLRHAIAAPPESECGFRVCDLQVGEWAGKQASPAEQRWLARLVNHADQLRANRLSFFDLQNKHLGDPIGWNRDHAAGIDAPMRFAPGIDYRDFKVTGDCKLVWEPNRHHHLVVLARAYRASGDVRYAEAIAGQLTSWLDQCPFGRGMNWRSPLELGIRLINWVWAIDMIRESGAIAAGLRERLLHSAYLQMWEITRKYSQSSSANNHTIGEAAGVYVASSYFTQLRDAAAWKAQARDILIRELAEQTYASGAGREQAMGYHLFVLHLFLLAALVGRHTGDEFPPEYWARMEKMFAFVAEISAGGPLPMFGDCDDAYVLDLGSRHGDAKGLLSTGAVLFRRGDFKRHAGEYAEGTRWLLGKGSRAEFEDLHVHAAPPASVAFGDAGVYLLQDGSAAGDRISVFFDCGEHGFKSIAAHGHADALAFTLRAFGEDVLVDPGTYDYFTYPEWRAYFRSTRAHNTVEIDGQDQSVMQGPFLWGKRANARCIRWEPRPDGGLVTGEHDGYTRLQDPVLHRRTIELIGAEGEVLITDELVCAGSHRATLHFHLGEKCGIEPVAANAYEIRLENGVVSLELDPRTSVRWTRGGDTASGGWVSRAYHVKSPAATLAAQITISGPTTVATRLRVQPKHLELQRHNVHTETGNA